MERPPLGPIEVTIGAPRVTSLSVGGCRVSVATFSPGYRIDSHWHERACLSVVLEGFFQQRFPGREYDCPAGGVLVKPPGERHVDRWGTAPSRHLIVEPESVDDATLGAARPLFERVTHRLDPAAVVLARRIVEELRAGDDLVALGVEALVGELVVLAARGVAEVADASEPPSWLRRVREALEDRYASPPRMEELAADAGVHPSRLSREFRRHYGTSPGAYLRGIRLDRALVDLSVGRDAIAAVALRHGYSDQSHLTREVRRATGLTPAGWRRHAGRR